MKLTAIAEIVELSKADTLDDAVRLCDGLQPNGHAPRSATAGGGMKRGRNCRNNVVLAGCDGRSNASFDSKYAENQTNTVATRVAAVGSGRWWEFEVASDSDSSALVTLLRGDVKDGNDLSMGRLTRLSQIHRGRGGSQRRKTLVRVGPGWRSRVEGSTKVRRHCIGDGRRESHVGGERLDVEDGKERILCSVVGPAVGVGGMGKPFSVPRVHQPPCKRSVWMRMEKKEEERKGCLRRRH